MAETRTWQGATYTRNGPNDPWVLVTPASGISVTALPESPGARADRQRADAAAGRDEAAGARDETRTGIAVREEGRGIEYKNREFERTLRSDYDALPAIKDYNKALPLFVQGLNSGNTPQGSNALIYAYATVMDPASSVREGESAGVAQSDTLFAQAEAYARKQLEGTGTFSPEARAGLLREMRTKMIQLVQAYDQQRNRFRADAQAYGLDPDRVIGPHAATPFVDELQSIDRREGRLTSEQQRKYDQIMSSSAGASADELKAKFAAAGLPVDQMTNLDEVVAARDSGRGVAPASAATYRETTGSYQDSLLGQGMSGVNEGIAGFLGFPVDALTFGMNLVPQGVNAVANTDLPTIDKPFLGGDWFRDRMDGWGIYQPTDDAGGQFARRVGQSIGSSVVPVGAAANTARQGIAGILAATAGGVGGATAQQVAPGNVGAEIAAELLLSGGTGLSAAALGRQARQRVIEEAVPTVPQLKDQARELYQRAEASGATAAPAETQQMADTLEAILRGEGRVSPSGRISEVSPEVAESMRQASEYAGQPMSPVQMETMRTVISDGLTAAKPNDVRIARLLLNEFDDWADPLVPGLPAARETASRYLTAEKLEQARELAGARAGQFTGSGFENALRTDYRALDRNAIKGRERFGDDLVAAVEDVSRGTGWSNTWRNLGRLYPNNPMSIGMGTVAPAALGTMIGGPEVGMLTGAAAGGIGALGRYAATSAGIRNADIAELLARNGGPVPVADLLTPDDEQLIAALIAAQTAEQMP